MLIWSFLPGCLRLSTCERTTCTAFCSTDVNSLLGWLGTVVDFVTAEDEEIIAAAAA